MVESAHEDYQSLEARDRSKIKSAMETYLRHEPTKESRRRIKRLRGIARPQYRLRVDEFRIFYDVEDETVTVLAIVAKSKAEEWLNKNAERSDDSNPAR